MKWFLNLLKSIWRWITQVWNWVVSKIKSVFSSKKNNNTDLEEQNQQQSRQEEVVVTPAQSPEHANSSDPVKIGSTEENVVTSVQNPGPTAYRRSGPHPVEVVSTNKITPVQNPGPTAYRESSLDPVKVVTTEENNVTPVQSLEPTTNTIKLPTSLIGLIGRLPDFIKSLANRLPDDVKSFILQDESISGLIKNYPTAFKIFMCKNRDFLSCDRENLEDNERFKKRLSDFSFCVRRLFKKDEELSGMFNHSEMQLMGYGGYPSTCLGKHRGGNYLLHLLEHLAKSNRKTPVSKLPDNIWSLINKSRDDVKYFMLQDESILESMKKYPKLCEAFANIECVYDVYKHGDIKSLFSNQSILELLEKDDELRSILIGEQIFSWRLNFNLLIDLLKHSSGDKSIFELIKKCPGAFFIFMHCNPASEGIKQFTKEDIERFTKRLSCYLSSISELIGGDEELANTLNSQWIYSGEYLNCNNNLYNDCFVNLLRHLLKSDEAMLNRIKNHSELARAVSNSLIKYLSVRQQIPFWIFKSIHERNTEILDTLFSQDKEDLLEKLEYDLEFTMDVITDGTPGVLSNDCNLENLISIMLCLKSKEDIASLKPILKSILHDYHHLNYKFKYIERQFSIFGINVVSEQNGQPYQLPQQLFKKFFEHHYNNPCIYKMAMKLGGIDLGVRISADNNNKEGEFPYYEESKTYQVHLPNNYTSDDIDRIIDKVLEEHFKRIEKIVKERSPEDYYKMSLEDHCDGQYIDGSFNSAAYNFDRDKAIKAVVHPLRNMRSLQHICLEQMIQDLNR